MQHSACARSARPDGTWFPEKSDTFQAMLRAAKGLRDVVQAGSPVLREPAKPVAPEKIGTPEIQARSAGARSALPLEQCNRPSAASELVSLRAFDLRRSLSRR